MVFTKRNNFQKIRSPWILVIFAQKLGGIYSKLRRTEKIFLRKIFAGGRLIFAKIRENAYVQIKSLYLIKMNFLMQTKVFNEEQLMPRNIGCVGSKIKTIDFSKSGTIQKNSCFCGFFHFPSNKKIYAVAIFWNFV